MVLELGQYIFRVLESDCVVSLLEMEFSSLSLSLCAFYNNIEYHLQSQGRSVETTSEETRTSGTDTTVRKLLDIMYSLIVNFNFIKKERTNKYINKKSWLKTESSLLTSFVEDRLATLKNVIKEPELDGWNLYLGKFSVSSLFPLSFKVVFILTLTCVVILFHYKSPDSSLYYIHWFNC